VNTNVSQKDTVAIFKIKVTSYPEVGTAGPTKASVSALRTTRCHKAEPRSEWQTDVRYDEHAFLPRMYADTNNWHNTTMSDSVTISYSPL